MGGYAPELTGTRTHQILAASFGNGGGVRRFSLSRTTGQQHICDKNVMPWRAQHVALCVVLGSASTHLLLAIGSIW